SFLEDSSNSSGTRDGIVRSFEDMPIDLNDVVRDFYHRMSEVRIDRILEVGEPQGSCYVGYREGSCEQSLTSHEEFRQVRRDRDDTRERLRRLELYVKSRLDFRP
ncbi:hypothetical protein Tco_0398973, partial [Tanacetum coccineum]